MQTTIRLHTSSDRDLIVIANHFDIHEIMRIALQSYVYKNPVRFYSEKTLFASKETLRDRKLTFTIFDPVVQKTINQVEKGCRGYYCKSILRLCLDGMCLDAFFEKDTIISLEKPIKSSRELVSIDQYEIIPKTRLKTRPKDLLVSTEQLDDVNIEIASPEEDVFFSAFNEFK